MAWDIWSGAWSEPELDVIDFALEPDEKALDIGANFGLWTYHLERHMSTGRVIAFEPIPSTFATLQLVARLLRFRNAEMHRLGCSVKGELAPFAVPLQDSGAIAAGLAHLDGRPSIQLGAEDEIPAQKLKEIWCEVVALDELLPGMDGVAFVKCDIEGAELLAFRGAEQLIRRNRPTVVCEVNSSFLKGFGFRVEDVIGFFKEKQYTAYLYRRDESPSLWELESESGVESQNLVFIHPSRLDRFNRLLHSSPADERTPF